MCGMPVVIAPVGSITQGSVGVLEPERDHVVLPVGGPVDDRAIDLVFAEAERRAGSGSRAARGRRSPRRRAASVSAKVAQWSIGAVGDVVVARLVLDPARDLARERAPLLDAERLELGAQVRCARRAARAGAPRSPTPTRASPRWFRAARCARAPASRRSSATRRRPRRGARSSRRPPCGAPGADRRRRASRGEAAEGEQAHEEAHRACPSEGHHPLRIDANGRKVELSARNQ